MGKAWKVETKPPQINSLLKKLYLLCCMRFVSKTYYYSKSLGSFWGWIFNHRFYLHKILVKLLTISMQKGNSILLPKRAETKDLFYESGIVPFIWLRSPRFGFQFMAHIDGKSFSQMIIHTFHTLCKYEIITVVPLREWWDHEFREQVIQYWGRQVESSRVNHQKVVRNRIGTCSLELKYSQGPGLQVQGEPSF